ncbi:MAG: ATP-grasp domain-containing protein [Deltaproteobacteria bacterium]|nr:ATP-grasp domain-containing protein [Deltaproteobacteria bacterium]
MFKKVLIANRGEIARRVARTCRRLGIATVAVYSDADADGPHVRECDEAVRVGPAQVKESYLNAAAIIEAARSTGAEAIHPGYGLLSEKSSFARAVREAGLVFIGPAPEALDAFGDKMRARHVALSAGVPPVPGVDEPIPTDDVARAKAEAARVGYPIVVKAVGGGGGIGMQVVKDEAGIERALKSCSDRGAQAFGDPRVYLERYVQSPRHIEVQVFCDAHGNAVALGERECSVQRRHQKILEESPSPLFVGEEGDRARKLLFDRALAVVTKAHYVNAGTVEFIVDAQNPSEPYFLEVNARLQVEHPVTEMCTGIDLVEVQLRVAAGEPLPDYVRNAQRRGASIEVRLYAEEPRKGFLPRPGPVDELAWPQAGDDLRVEAGVEQGSKVTPYYDPMIAKIVSYGGDRDQAIARLDRALSELKIGPVITNRDFLRDVLSSQRFRAGDYDTLFAEALAKQPV